jgi:tRNA threonylcarbamoyl adenosine modification protein YjeE
VTLSGPLGAGKTTFAQGFGEALGLPPGEVASPTFSLADVHRAGHVTLNHLDLYRLGGDGGPPEAALREFLEAGLDECLETGYSLVEWPERLPDAFWPPGACRVLIRMGGGEAPGPSGPPRSSSPSGTGDLAAAPPEAGAPGDPLADDPPSPGRTLRVARDFPLPGLRELMEAVGLVPLTS